MELCSASCPGGVANRFRDRLAPHLSVLDVGAAATTTSRARDSKSLATPRSKNSTGRCFDGRI
eukprot:6005724-Heterocapsa_arctica.AAC.1